MAKKKTAQPKKSGMKKIFEVPEKESSEVKKADIEELKRKIMEWSKKSIPNNIRRRPCGGCDVILGDGAFRIKR